MRWLLNAVLVLIGLAAIIAVGGYFALKRDDIPYERLESQYGSPASQYVDLPGGVRMHFRDQGQGPVLLLIHGFSASLHTWEPWVDRLATGENRLGDYRVISIDLPGHGLTRAPAGYQASIEAYRDAVQAFVAARGLTSFALAGNSMGGNVAWEYALAHPEQVNALILVDASGWQDTRPEAAEEPLVFRLMRNRTLGSILLKLDSSRLVRQGLEAAFYDPALVDEAMLDRYTRMGRAPGHREILLQMTLGFRARNFATAERLAPLSMPVLVMTGDTDRLVPPEHATQFHEAIAGSQLVVLEHTGHVPQEERPDESAMAVHEFLHQAAERAPAAAAR